MQFIIIVSSLLPSVCERISIGYTPTMEKEEGGVSLFSLIVSPMRRRNKRAGAHCSVSVVLFSPLSFRVMRYTHVAMAAATRHQIVLPFNDWRCRDPLQTHTHTHRITQKGCHFAGPVVRDLKILPECWASVVPFLIPWRIIEEGGCARAWKRRRASVRGSCPIVSLSPSFAYSSSSSPLLNIYMYLYSMLPCCWFRCDATAFARMQSHGILRLFDCDSIW